MAGASTSVYEFNSVVRGQHLHKIVYTPLTDKTDMQENNKHNKYAASDQL